MKFIILSHFFPIMKKVLTACPKDVKSFGIKRCLQYSLLCGAVYIDETGRSIKTFRYEHQPCLKIGLLTYSAVNDHQQNTGHKINYNNRSVLVKSVLFSSKNKRLLKFLNIPIFSIDMKDTNWQQFGKESSNLTL